MIVSNIWSIIVSYQVNKCAWVYMNRPESTSRGSTARTFLHVTLLAPKSGGSSSYSLESPWALFLRYITQCFSMEGPRVDSIVFCTTQRLSL
jgi:hypothetical protein